MNRRAFRLAGLFAILLQTAGAAPVVVSDESGVTVSFEVTGDADQVKAFRRDILPEIKGILAELSQDLVVTEAKGAQIHFYAPETYYTKFPDTVEKQIPAFYRNGEVHARADNDVNHALKSTLRHELTHLLLDRAYKRIPGWVNEGLAMYEERRISMDPEPNNVDYNTIAVAKQDQTYLPLSQLESYAIFGRSHGTVTMKLAYTIAYVAVWEMKEKVGLSGIRDFLKGISSGKAIGPQFEASVGMPYEKFNEHLLAVAEKKKS